MYRQRERTRLTLALAFFFGLGCGLPARAQQQAARPLVFRSLSWMLTPLPGDKEAYLMVTAGGASTDVLLIANPSVPPQALIRALQSTVSATPLRSQPVEWSSSTDRIPWVAAHTSLRRGHFGAWQATNTVPLAALKDGLRRAGWKPHPGLHLPVGASCAGLPAPFADYNGDRWYSLKTMRPQAFLQVSSAVAPGDLWPLLLPLLLLPLLGLAAQAAAVRWAHTRDPERQGRKRFDGISSAPVAVGLIGWMIFSMGHLPPLHGINDVWLGRAGDGDGSLFSAWFILVLMTASSTLWNGQRRAIRLYGPEGAVPASAMSAGERALREREELWGVAIPILMCGAVLALLVGGFTWLPARFAGGAVRLIPLLLVVPIGLYFSKRRKAFTTLVPDAGLTDAARHLVAAPGLPPAEVVVERSARAKTYAFMEGGKEGRVVVSQKLTEIASPEQMRFLLASQAVLGRTRDWSKTVSLLTVVVVLGGLVGVTQLAPLHYFALSISLMVALIAAMFVSVFVTTKQSENRLRDADREALRLTGDRDTAVEALELVQQNTMPSSRSGAAQSQAGLQLAKRIAALKKEGAGAVIGR